MTKDEIVIEIDKIQSDIRARMDTVSDTLISLMPTEYDWATPEERTKLHNLKLQLPSYFEEAQMARERLRIKRLNRNKVI